MQINVLLNSESLARKKRNRNNMLDGIVDLVDKHSVISPQLTVD